MSESNEAARAAWDHNAAFWDARMAEGNAFVEWLIWPATERLLAPRAGERVLDVACGNGVLARRIAAHGCHVVAFDFAAGMVVHARARGGGEPGTIDYQVLDATDASALSGLAPGAFDAVHCGMALFDMAALDPLARAVPTLLRPGGRLVFSVLHPCFTPNIAELEIDARGPLVRMRRYLGGSREQGEAFAGQPMLHPYFERPLSELLAPFFAAGLALDGLEERAFPEGQGNTQDPPRWDGRFHEFPPVLVARMRPTPG